MDPMSGFDIRLLFTLAPRDSTLHYKDVYTSEMTFLALHPWIHATHNLPVHPIYASLRKVELGVGMDR